MAWSEYSWSELYLHIFILLCFYNMLLQIGDSKTTDRVIANGGYESNDALALWMGNKLLRPFRWSFKLGVAVILLWVVYRYSDGVARCLFAFAVSLPFVWVIVHNLGVYRRQEIRKTFDNVTIASKEPPTTSSVTLQP